MIIRRSLSIALLALAASSLAATAQAQTGPCPTADPGFQVNPTRGCFRVNVAQHNEVDPVTQVAKVSRYELEFFDEGVDVTQATPIQPATTIGKPAIADAGTGTIWFGAGTPVTLPAYPLGRRVKSVVRAVGPSGSSPRGVDATSNPFGRSNPVTAIVAPTGHRLTPE